MTTAVPVVSVEATVADVERLLTTKHHDFKSIAYVYVTDRNDVLCGVVSIRTLFRVPKITKVKEVMTTDVVSVRLGADQKKVAKLALHTEIKAVPVVDKEGRLAGVVSADAIFSILHDEAKKEKFLSAGVRHMDHAYADIVDMPFRAAVLQRLPWLVVGLVGGILAAYIISHFEAALELELLLAAFIAPLVYMADAAGTQSGAMFIESHAHREKPSLKTYLVKELRISALLAAVLAFLLAAVAWLWFGSMFVGLVVLATLFAAILFANMVAVLLPWLLIKLKKDPALGSGPFATIVTDVVTILIYFGIVQLMLPLLS